MTAELLSYLFKSTGETHVALAPSQRKEGKFGYDVGYFGTGWVALIQYKRAKRTKTGLRWDLNRTRGQDQHEILQRLELGGVPVFYAFPSFTEPAELKANRIQLLRKVYWYRPSRITPPGGPRGHHHVTLHEATNAWLVHSDNPVSIAPPDSIGGVIEAGQSLRSSDLSLEDFDGFLSDLLAEAQLSREDDALEAEGVDRAPEFPDFFQGQSLVMSSGEPTGAE